MIYKILSVGNNEVDNDDLSSCLTKFAERFQIKFELTSIKTGISFLSSYKKRYDLIFISIELPDINGIQATRELRKIDQDTFLILLSNVSHYALDGYELGASDYILKPIKYQNFERKLSRILKKIILKNDESILINLGNKKKVININEIKYVEIMSHDIMIHLDKEIVKTTGVLTKFEKTLNNPKFKRCSACALINLSYIDEIKGNDIKLITGEIIRIGRTKKKEFIKELNAYLKKN